MPTPHLAADPDPQPIAAGSEIDQRYRVIKAIGQGAFGTTYLALNLRLEKKVVIKIARRPDAETASRLTQEARTLVAIQHPNIANILDTGQLPDGRPYLVVEWVQGSPLNEILSQGPIPLPKALVTLRALTEALGQAHRAHIIHRDIKPQNVIIPTTDAGPVYANATLVDFGVAGALESTTPAESATATGQFFGTPYYMSPEQIMARPQAVASDFYGLGVLFHEMIFGFPPYKRDGQSLTEFLISATREEVTFPATPTVADGAKALLSELLAKDPNARLSSTTALLDRLDALMHAPPPPTAFDAYPPPTPAPAPGIAGWDTTIPPPSPRVAEVATSYSAPSRPPIALRNLSLAALAIGLIGGIGFIASEHIDTLTKHTHTAIGIAILLLAIPAGALTRRAIAAKQRSVGRKIEAVITGATTHETLSTTLAIQVEELVQHCESASEKVLGMTIANMVVEYRRADSSSDRQAALMNAAQLLEKLTTALTPWYVRHDKLIATSVTLIGVITGLVTTILTVYSSLHGTPAK